MKIVITESQYNRILNEQSGYEKLHDIYNSIVNASKGWGTNPDEIYNAISKLQSSADFVYLKTFFDDGRTDYKSFDDMVNGEYDSLNYNDVNKLTSFLNKLGVTASFNYKKDLIGGMYFNKGFKSSVSMASETAACKTKFQGLLSQAKDWWLKWLSDPITKQKFLKNWKVRPNGVVKGIKVDDIFKNYIALVNNVKPDYYTAFSPITLTNKIDVRNVPSGEDESIIAFVAPEKFGSDKIFVNCSNIDGHNALRIIIHEIQHILFAYVPLNPEKQITGIYSSKTSTPYDPMKQLNQVVANYNNKKGNQTMNDAENLKGVNMKNLVNTSKKYNIPDTILKNWYKEALATTSISLNAVYVCNETEKMSNIMSLRKELNILPSQNIQYKDILPYIIGQKKDVDANWLLYCWALNGFPDIQGWINNMNMLAINTRKNNSTQV